MMATVLAGVLFDSLRIGWAFGEGDLMTWTSVFLLFIASYLSHKIWHVRSAGRPFSKLEGHALWRLLGYGFCFLALDDLFRIHETTDNTLHKIAGVKPSDLTDHFDDAIIAMYGIVGLYWLIKYRRELFQYLNLWRYLLGAALCTIATVMFDFVSSSKSVLMEVLRDPEHVQLTIAITDVVEEFFKIYAEVFFVGGFLALFTRVSIKAHQRATTQGAAA